MQNLEPIELAEQRLEQINYFEWRSEYEVGSPALDDQHKQLLSICCRANECVHETSPECHETFHSILHDLAQYASYHFRFEEQLLRENNCPGLAAHIAEHDQYQEALADILMSATIGTASREELKNFVLGWWLNHICESDMKCALYLRVPEKAHS